MPPARRSRQRLTVAVTGPTGDIGRSLLQALEKSAEVGRIVAMARRPFDPAEAGLRKTDYRQGDVLDRVALDELFPGADVIVHLAFLIMGNREQTQSINLEGSRNVFQAAADAGVKRLVYASSVAAYGFHAENPPLLTEELPPRGTDRHYYSAQKAKLEGVLRAAPGRHAHRRLRVPPLHRRRTRRAAAAPEHPLRAAVERHARSGRCALLELVPALAPVLPDPGVPFQLVHHDDVATAFRAAVLGRRRTRRLQPRGPRDADDVRHRGRAGLVQPAGAGDRAGRDRRAWSRTCRSCPPRRSGSRRSACRC